MDGHTTAVVERYLNDLAGVRGDSPAEPIIRDLLAAAVNRLHVLCASLLYRSYPRLTHPPMNLQAEELLSAVVERLLKAMRQVRPATVRQFFALASQHMRWELNDLARRLDRGEAALELRESRVAAPWEPRLDSAPPGSGVTQGGTPGGTLSRLLFAIDHLPEEEREAFNLVRVQGVGMTEAARMVGVSSKTIQRRLKRSLILLTEQVGDLGSDGDPLPMDRDGRPS